MVLNFSYNWNQKLGCQSFTTIRKSYYNPGVILQIHLKNEYQFDAEILEVKSFKLPQLSNFMSFLDTGYNSEDCKKILRTMYGKRYPNLDEETFYFHLLNRIKSVQNV